METTFFKHMDMHKPYPGQEAESLEKMKRFMETDGKDNLFSRSNQEGHFTASAWVVNAQMDKVLLVHHKKLNKWLQPGGHADGSDDILAMARQEVWEETGLKNVKLGYDGIFDVDAHPIPEAPKNGVMEPAHTHYDIRYLLIADENTPLAVSDESNDLSWFDLDKAVQFNPELERMVLKTQKLSQEN